MAIQKGCKSTLEMIIIAAKRGDLCLMECTDKITGRAVITICANWIDKEGMYNFTPMAKMFDGNPYDEVKPPMEE